MCLGNFLSVDQFSIQSTLFIKHFCIKKLHQNYNIHHYADLMIRFEIAKARFQAQQNFLSENQAKLDFTCIEISL